MLRVVASYVQGDEILSTEHSFREDDPSYADYVARATGNGCHVAVWRGKKLLKYDESK